MLAGLDHWPYVLVCALLHRHEYALTDEVTCHLWVKQTFYTQPNRPCHMSGHGFNILHFLHYHTA